MYVAVSEAMTACFGYRYATVLRAAGRLQAQGSWVSRFLQLVFGEGESPATERLCVRILGKSRRCRNEGNVQLRAHGREYLSPD
jgi:hypothetical protein